MPSPEYNIIIVISSLLVPASMIGLSFHFHVLAYPASVAAVTTKYQFELHDLFAYIVFPRGHRPAYCLDAYPGIGYRWCRVAVDEGHAPGFPIFDARQSVPRAPPT